MVHNKAIQRGKPMKRMISRLISWLNAHGFSAADIVDCIDYIIK